jgi:predicted enzyme related to lactoylglutathione lyase
VVRGLPGTRDAELSLPAVRAGRLDASSCARVSRDGTRRTGAYFNVESVDQAYKELTARGYKFNEEPYDVPVGRLVTINDPDGNIVGLEDRSKGGLARVGI